MGCVGWVKGKQCRNVESFEPLDAKDRLVWRSLVGGELMTLAIDHQIKFFKHGDAQKNLLSDYHGGSHRIASKHFNEKCFTNIDLLNAPIGILRFSAPKAQKSQLLSNSWWQNRARCSGINQGLSFIAMHVSGVELTESSENRFAIIA